MGNTQDDRINEINSIFSDDFKLGAELLESKNNPENYTPNKTETKYVIKGFWKFVTYNSILLFIISVINFGALNIIALGKMDLKTIITTLLITILLYSNFYIFNKMGIDILLKK